MTNRKNAIRGAKEILEGIEKLKNVDYNSASWGEIEYATQEGSLNLYELEEDMNMILKNLLEDYAEQKMQNMFAEISDELGLESGDMTPLEEKKIELAIKNYIKMNL